MLFGFEGPLLDLAESFFATAQSAGQPRAPSSASHAAIAIDLSPVAKKRVREPVLLDSVLPVEKLNVRAYEPPREAPRREAPRHIAASAPAPAPPPAALAPPPAAAALVAADDTAGEGLAEVHAAPAPFNCTCCGRVERPPDSRPAAAGQWHRCALDVHNWDVILIVDTREIAGRTDRSYIRAQLMSAGVPVEVRALAVGDMMWVARRTAWPQSSTFSHAAPAALAEVARGAASVATGAKPSRKDRTAALGAVARFSADCGTRHEFPLNFVVERKTCVDLAASIVDGRYYEQKTRLAATGLRVSYVVEGDPSRLADSGFVSLTPKHITTSLVTTAVANNFHVVQTHSGENPGGCALLRAECAAHSTASLQLMRLLPGSCACMVLSSATFENQQSAPFTALHQPACHRHVRVQLPPGRSAAVAMRAITPGVHLRCD